MADLGQTQAFPGVTGLELALEERGQLCLHRGGRLDMTQPFGRRVAPVGPLRTQFVASLDGHEGLGEPALAPQCGCHVTVGLGVLRVEFDGLLVALDGLVHLPGVTQAQLPR